MAPPGAGSTAARRGLKRLWGHRRSPFPVGAGGPGPHTRNERPAARQLPLRLRNMKDTTNTNVTNNHSEEPDDPLAAYTPQQRRTIIKGLRILARVAIRSYLREQAEQARDEGGGGGEEG